MVQEVTQQSGGGYGLSKTEQIALKTSKFEAIYPPTEKTPTIVVEYFPALGKLSAVRFLEWVQDHPGGVISLPTGKTPEHFIKWVQHFLKGWDTPEVQAELEQVGVDPSRRPDMKSLHFVQIDEFYPIESSRHNSFYYYVNTFYIQGFGLDPAKALLMDASRLGLTSDETLADVWPDGQVDLTLRYRHPRNLLEQKQKVVLERIDGWCMDYERRIQALGGIGFFLGGIGPDGHIGFNISGSDHYSTTRLCPINYETQAAASTDLGGIEIARKSLVITIGLRTITQNPDCVALILAAGEAKAGVTAAAIQSPRDVHIPATALQILPNARFYITQGAAKHLVERQLARLKAAPEIQPVDSYKILVDLAVEKHKKLTDLTEADCQSNPNGRLLLSRLTEPVSVLTSQAKETLIANIANGMNVQDNKRFLHTEPHHDDVMLGYFASVVRHFRKAGNTHYFMTLTSGFTSVTNDFMKKQVANLRRCIELPAFRRLMTTGYFLPGDGVDRNRDVWQYLDGVAARSEPYKMEGCARRLLRNLVEIYGSEVLVSVENRLAKLDAYFDGAYPGKKDSPEMQQLKGMCREWEAECLWGYYGWKCDNVRHLRLGFYTGDIFTREPQMEQDVLPIVKTFDEVNPDVVTVAFDPEGSGPDTHYKVLQAISEALKIYERKSGRKDIKIWGYRNVWYRFEPSEANCYVPVSLCMLNVMHEAFQNSFLSQKDASFPSYEHDGPFSELAQKIQVSQYQTIKTCLGRDWFYDHSSALIRATRGFVFLRQMQTEEFYQSCRELKRSVESR
ncbi:MAG: glucosamine-6-phosphate deaminase [Anaerohalosphaeraceae bacterium]